MQNNMTSFTTISVLLKPDENVPFALYLNLNLSMQYCTINIIMFLNHLLMRLRLLIKIIKQYNNITNNIPLNVESDAVNVDFECANAETKLVNAKDFDVTVAIYLRWLYDSVADVLRWIYYEMN